jgi:hypothetical protein
VLILAEEPDGGWPKWAQGADYAELYTHIGVGPRFVGGAGSVAEAEVSRRLTEAVIAGTRASEKSSKVLIWLTAVLVLLTIVLVVLAVAVWRQGPLRNGSVRALWVGLVFEIDRFKDWIVVLGKRRACLRLRRLRRLRTEGVQAAAPASERVAVHQRHCTASPLVTNLQAPNQPGAAQGLCEPDGVQRRRVRESHSCPSVLTT